MVVGCVGVVVMVTETTTDDGAQRGETDVEITGSPGQNDVLVGYVVAERYECWSVTAGRGFVVAGIDSDDEIEAPLGYSIESVKPVQGSVRVTFRAEEDL
jgi:hypothetical protein